MKQCEKCKTTIERPGHIDGIDLLQCDCGLTVTATWNVGNWERRKPLNEQMMESIIDDLMNPIMGSSTDAELAQDHRCSVEDVRQARHRLASDTRIGTVYAMAKEIAHEIGWDPNRPAGDLVIDVLRMFREQTRRGAS